MANVPQDVYGRFGVSKKDKDQINKGVYWTHSFCETGIRYYHGDNSNFGICYDMAKNLPHTVLDHMMNHWYNYIYNNDLVMQNYLSTLLRIARIFVYTKFAKRHCMYLDSLFPGYVLNQDKRVRRHNAGSVGAICMYRLLSCIVSTSAYAERGTIWTLQFAMPPTHPKIVSFKSWNTRLSFCKKCVISRQSNPLSVPTSNKMQQLTKYARLPFLLCFAMVS